MRGIDLAGVEMNALSLINLPFIHNNKEAALPSD